MKIAFFCSARENIKLKYENQVIELLQFLNDNIPFTHVVYGGGKTGLMGTVYSFFKGSYCSVTDTSIKLFSLSTPCKVNAGNFCPTVIMYYSLFNVKFVAD